MDIMSIASIGMQADIARMESISHNTANALTPGFKRQIPTTPSFSVQMQQGLMGQVTPVMVPAPSATHGGIDPSAGSLRPTGNFQDVAIEGPGFFEVQSPTGSLYTRQGSLRTDVQGRLVVGQDLPVMGVGGEIRLTNTPFSIASNGDITQDGRIVGRLKVVNFAKPEMLIPNGAAMYQAGTAQTQDARASATLRVGFLEGSNVSTPQEMVRMTETVRHFESLQKVVQGYDDLLEKTIRKLGDF